MGVPAAVDPRTGAVLHPTTLAGWPVAAVTEAVAARWSLPLVVENDARAAALGECRSDEETLVYVTVATGIGCGIVVGGDVLRGAGGVAGDIGRACHRPRPGPAGGPPRLRPGGRGRGAHLTAPAPVGDTVPVDGAVWPALQQRGRLGTVTIAACS